ncbi:hypothetical protein SKAU_G00355530 [Synaphobranchus kaupii]|uniref:Leptin receptor n=1 Tax=Synaphobranchus kaupii TaxID=118154 RepID=A0A9Q1EHC5_SYNKA|nr:hypothetical protein SKAU_G00355530 [Synaphobranchus kaupii]
MGSWWLWALLIVLKFQENHSNDTMLGLPVPQAVELVTDEKLQHVSVTWKQSPLKHNLTEKLLFDIEVLRNGVVVQNGTTEAVQHWNWTSPIPLNCASHSVRVRVRLLNRTSQWSPEKSVYGMDVSDHSSLQVYPRDRVVRAGSTMHFCCIVSAGHMLKRFTYNGKDMAATKISDRSYTIIVRNLTKSESQGTDAACEDNGNGYSPEGATVFVGYPPGDHNLECETDLVYVVCHWKRGQITHLLGNRRTLYTLNGSNCSKAIESSASTRWIRCLLSGPLDGGKRNWTLTATNPLGSIIVQDRADLSHRVRLQAPSNVTSTRVNDGNASVRWIWEVGAYRTLPLLCQLELKHNDLTETRHYPGLGLSEQLLTGLQPDRQYSLRVRCRTQHDSWHWSNWSSAHTFRTKEGYPDPLDVWIHMNDSNSARFMWKPLSTNQSRGQIKGYVITWNSSMGRQNSSVSPEMHSFFLRNLGDGVATVTAFNSAGSSPPSSIGLPRLSGDAAQVSRISGINGGFDLSWPASPRATWGYVVEWYPTYRERNYTVDWVKVPAQSTRARIPPEHFATGVKYSLSVYSCNQEVPELLVKKEGYAKEMAPGQPVQNLIVSESGSEVRLRWDEVPPESQRGFIRGYSVYHYNSSSLVLTANITDPDERELTMKNLRHSSYTFIVKAYTLAGEDSGDMISIQRSHTSDWLISLTLVSLGSMACFLFLTIIICYRKRRWLKEKIYPVIPEPKLPHDWLTSPMLGPQRLDVTQCTSDRIDVISGLTGNLGNVVKDEEGRTLYPPDTDSSSPSQLRLYQQVPGMTSQRCVTQAPPATSPGTRHTEVTYTAVQTPLALSLDVPPPDKFSRPQISAAHPAEAPADLPLLLDSGGYQPQPQPSHRPRSRVTGGPEESLDTPTSASSVDLPLLLDSGGYMPQPQPSHWPRSRVTGSPVEPVDTPTSTSSITLLLGGSASDSPEQNTALPSPAWPHSPHFTNPTYQPTGFTHF